jgi:hypothetical protein
MGSALPKDVKKGSGAGRLWISDFGLRIVFLIPILKNQN